MDWVLIPACIGFMLLRAEAGRRKKQVAALIFKTLASLSFVALGILSFMLASDKRSAGFFLAGLICGAVGDVLLGLTRLLPTRRIVFLAGGFVFLIGHFLYLVPLVSGVGTFLWPAIGVSLLIATLLLLFLHRKGIRNRVLFTCSIFYFFAVTAVAVFAVFALFSGAPGPGQILRAVGGLLFLASDTILFFRLEQREGKGLLLGALILLTYYPAQCLIAYSIRFL